MTDAAAKQHYARFGRQERRPANAAEFLSPLERELGALPSDFSGAGYQKLNPDIAEKIPNVWRATEHYLRFGRREGRRHIELDLELYKALNGLDAYHSDADLLAHYAAHKTSNAILKSGADFMRSRGLEGGGAWLERLNLMEFRTLNWDWAQDAETKLQAGDLILSQGRARLAPLSFDLRFDPAYYLDAHPELKGASPETLYDHWLFKGLEKNEPGLERARLKQLGLDLMVYPEGFLWRAYLSQHKLRQGDRWSALEHCVRNPKPSGLPPHAPDAAGVNFLSALGKAFSSRNDPFCIELLIAAQALGELAVDVRQFLADALYRQTRWATAGAIYASILEDAGANVWTLVNGARALIEQKKADAAADLLLKHGEPFRGDPWRRAVVGEAVSAVFAESETRARRCYLGGERAAGDAIMVAAVERCHDLWSRLDPIGAPIAPRASEKKIVILANTDLRQCTHYRVEQKAEILKAMGAKFEIFAASQFEEFMAALPGAAAAIFYRLAALPQTVRAIEAARTMGVPTYYEIDDMIFGPEYPDRLETYGQSFDKEEYAGLQFGVPLFRQAMARCDYGVSSTQSLAKAMAEVVRTGEVFVVFNGLDSRNAALTRRRARKLRRDDGVVVFYGSGTRAHNEDFLALAGPALIQLMSEHENVRLLIVGFLELDARFEAFRHRITQIGFVPNVDAYWSILMEADINVAVLRPGPLTDGKSEIKWLEAAALSIPSIVSDTATYNEVLEDGVDALIAASPEEWLAALRTLVTDPDRRRETGESARNKALANYGLKANAARMTAALAPAMTAYAASILRRNRAQRPKRVLLTNVFFPPQTIGGATRVVRDNLDYFLSNSDADRPEFAVAASDVAASIPGRLRVDSYGGAPVFRISTPAQEHMDWRPVNEGVGRVFGRVLDIQRPDLVHFHATQRLTASAIRECRRRKIPYLITAHDAWWISDFQFLIDDHGALVDPADVLDVPTPRGISLGESLQRRRLLGRALKGAAALLSVSDSFAELYTRCGAPCVSIPNGVASPPSARAKGPSSGRVRLAHVGGQTFHKGYHLVEAALRRGGFSNLELTVVDHKRSGGAARSDLWGATPVRFVGMTAQEAMGGFYSEQDVLLAPSIWPESFGLVTREALAAGLWVVASDRGAIGDDVAEGLNGFVVDVSSPEALFQTFSKLNADPIRYGRSPEPVRIRTSDEQGAALLNVYREIMDRFTVLH